MSPVQQQKFLNDITFLKSLGLSPEDEVCEVLDFVQSTLAEKQALSDFVDYSATMKDTDEWCPMTEDLLFGSLPEDKDKFYLELIDLAEMSDDMIAWLREEACHELFANQHFDSRTRDNTYALNKRSEISLCGQVTKIGDDYATMDCQYGKIFIPKYLLGKGHHCDVMVGGDDLQVRAQFKGFSNVRMGSRISMPWRAVFIEKNYGDEGIP